MTVLQDKSPQILQEYSEKDPRIVVINQEQSRTICGKKYGNRDC